MTARTIIVDDAIEWLTGIAYRMEKTDVQKAATVHEAIGHVCNFLADELRAEAARRPKGRAQVIDGDFGGGK